MSDDDRWPDGRLATICMCVCYGLSWIVPVAMIGWSAFVFTVSVYDPFFFVVQKPAPDVGYESWGGLFFWPPLFLGAVLLCFRISDSEQGRL